ncbi:C-X-C chemokine receptor type 6-like [Hyperolius riggenbachi]|uniref:C-X-C chemokine receptor type 6-like n=1 Tax=Hyperolius riggenbachi TaxID=752182 RepID=UPI0035A26731
MNLDDYYNDLHESDTTGSSPIHSLFLPITYSITCIVGMVGNLLVISVFAFYEKKKSLTDIFFVNLAVADFLFVCTLPFLAYYSAHKWIFGNAMCKIIRGLYRINLYTSMLTLTAITFDRFISIVIATKAQRYQQSKHKWGGGMCALIWLISLCLAIPQLVFATSNGKDCDDNHEKWLQTIVYSVQLAVGFFLPLSVMVLCYTFIINTLVRSRSSQKKKSIKIILTLVVAFAVTHLPFNVTFLLYLLTKLPPPSLTTALTITEAIAFVHACMNPILYFFVGTKFKNSFKRMLKALGLAGRGEEPDRVTEGSSKYMSGSTNMEAISMHQT